jgi:hypothetical protein
MAHRNVLRSVTALLFALMLGLGTDAFAQQYERFTGRLLDSGGTPLQGRVTINGAAKVTATDGTFEIYALYAERYVIQATKLGYVPVSRIHTGVALEGMELRMSKAEVFTLNASQRTDVTDSRGTRIVIPAGSLVDAQGRAPTGPVQLSMRTYDLRNEQMVGDMSGIGSDGRPVYLSSIGAFSAEFTDAAGTFYNLLPGRRAGISMPVDPANPFTGPVPLWWYDTTRGLWVEEGMGTVQNGVATGEVSHFTVWNFDIKNIDPACIRLTVDPTYLYTFPSPGGVLSVKVTVPQPWQRVVTMQVTTPGPHAIYNLPPNTNVSFSVGNNTPFAIVNTGLPWGGVGTPPHPYSVCKGSLHVTAASQVGQVQGRILRQHRTNHGGVMVALRNGGTVVGSAVTDATGAYTLMVPPGTVSARATYAGNLYAEKNNIVVAAGGSVTLPTVTLLAGDVDNNGCVTWAGDLMPIGNANGTAASANDPRNINGDGVINLVDLNLATANGDKCSPAAIPW